MVASFKFLVVMSHRICITMHLLSFFTFTYLSPPVVLHLPAWLSAAWWLLPCCRGFSFCPSVFGNSWPWRWGGCQPVMDGRAPVVFLWAGGAGCNLFCVATWILGHDWYCFRFSHSSGLVVRNECW